MTDDLVAFIKARLDEDEARVRNDIEWWFNEATTIRVYDGNTGMLVAGGGDYILPFIDPARVLRGVKVKRRIVNRSARWLDGYTGDDHGAYFHVQDTLKVLASEWPTHDDYREEAWKP